MSHHPNPMMECGHAANAHDKYNNPTCAICIGIYPGATTVAKNPPNLEGRQATCTCGNLKQSSTNLPFFEFLGPGATDDTCANCGYYEIAHTRKQAGESTSRLICDQFKPLTEGREFDSYYCGCRGWD